MTELDEDPEQLARLAIRESANAIPWMKSHGVRFQPALGGTLHLDRTNAFFLGGGKALLNSYYAAAQKRGVQILYNAEVTALNLSGGIFESGIVQVEGEPVTFRAKALVAASFTFMRMV